MPEDDWKQRYARNRGIAVATSQPVQDDWRANYARNRGLQATESPSASAGFPIMEDSNIPIGRISSNEMSAGPPFPAPVDPVQQRFAGAVSALPPMQQSNVIAAQNENRFYDPVGGGSTTEKAAVEFVSPVLDIVGGVPSRLLGIQTPTLAESLPPPRTREEAIARGVSGIAGEAASFMVPSGPMTLAKGASAAAKGFGRLGQLGAGVIGFTAPGQLGEVIAGDVPLGHAAAQTAMSPLTLPYDVAKAATVGAYKTGKAVLDPSVSPEATQAAFEELRPAAAIGLAHSLKPKGKVNPNDPALAAKPAAEGVIPTEIKLDPARERPSGAVESIQPQQEIIRAEKQSESLRPEVGQEITSGEAKGQGEIEAETSQLARLVAEGKEKVTSFARRFFTTKGDLPDEVFQAKLDKDAKVQEQSKDVAFTIRDFDRAARESFGSFRKMPTEAIESIDAAFKGEEALHRIPESMQGPVSVMRDKVDAMSRRLIESGAVEGDIVGTIEKNMGVYAKRSYRVFDDPKWSKKVPVEVRNAAKAMIRSEYPERSASEVDGLIASLLYEGKAAESPIDVIRKGSKLGAKDLSILTRRKDIAPELRALWGEYKDARVNYARSVESMSRLIANHEFLSRVKAEGGGKFLHDKPIILEGKEYKTRIAAEASDVMYPLNGLYTTPEIKSAFERVMKPQQQPAWLSAYMKVNGAVKYSKTVASLQTHIRNLIGNTGFAVANGHWRAWKAGAVGKAIATNVGLANSEGGREYVKKLTRLGILDEGVNAGEMRDVIADASGKDPNSFTDKYSSGLARRGLKAVEKLYQAEDNVWKVYAFENEVARYKKAYPGESIESIEKRAATIVRNTYPTYSMIPEGIKALRRFPVMGTFVSFPAEVARVGYHTIKLAAEELKDPRTRSIGAERLAGILTAATATTAIAAATRHINGITRDEDEDLREFMPPWSQNSQIAYLYKDNDGKVGYVDIGYTDPWNYLKNPVVAMMRGDDWESKLLMSAAEAASPFLSEELLASKLIDIARNKKESGGQIYNAQAPFEQKAAKVLEHIYEAIEPGTVTSVRRIAKGISGQTNIYGQSYDPKLEAMALFTGHRLSKLDVNQALSFKARAFARQLPDATALVTVPLTRQGTVDPQEIISGHESAISSRKTLFEELSGNVSAARRLGISDSNIFKTLTSSGISQENAALLMSGKVPAMSIGRSTIEKALTAPGGKERIEAFKKGQKKNQEK